MDQVAISEGIGGTTIGTDSAGTNSGLVNTRQNFIQGIDKSTTTAGAAGQFDYTGQGIGIVPNTTLGSGLTATGASYCTRRYQINLAAGLMTQDKLLPVKFMVKQKLIILGFSTSY
jgi:hypothetical protein